MKKKTKKEQKAFNKFVSGLIKKHDNGLAFNQIDMSEFSEDEWDGDESLYAEFDYQIDDRVDESGQRDDEKIICKNIEKALIDEFDKKFGASLNRNDAYPNGYASYTLTVDY